MNPQHRDRVVRARRAQQGNPLRNRDVRMVASRRVQVDRVRTTTVVRRVVRKPMVARAAARRTTGKNANCAGRLTRLFLLPVLTEFFAHNLIAKVEQLLRVM